MPNTFATRNQEISHFNAGNTNIQKRAIGKTIQVAHAKADTDVSDSPKKKERVPTPRDVLNDFLESTSIHGFQYFGRTDIRIGVFGKIFWACTILTGFVCLSLMVIQFLRRYNDNPTNTYIKSFYNPIVTAPFPAVTICPLAPIPLQRRLTTFDGLIMPQNVSREQVMNVLKYAHYITLPYAVKGYKGIETVKLILEANHWTVTDFLKILQPCEDIVEACWWNSERMDCHEFLTISHTSYGLCCSFNYLLEEYMGREKGQPKPKPITSADYGRRSGLKLLMKREIFTVDDVDDSNEYAETVINSDSIMVLLHHSMDFPGLNTNTYIIQNDNDMELGVQPEVFTKPTDLFHRDKRNEVVAVCVAEDENTLEYFPTYRYSNCYANCRVRAMIELCGCLPFIFDHIAKLYRINRCETDGLACIQMNSKRISIVRDVFNGNFTCSCRTPCEDVIYQGHPNSIDMMKIEASLIYRHISNYSAILRVFMESQIYESIETLPAADEVYLLASVGGIFSLFLGCSFLSLVEILYFLGLMCRAILRRRKNESPPKRERLPRDNFANTRPCFY